MTAASTSPSDAATPRPAADTTRPANGGPIRIAFYGDDFTGTTDAMEALALAGLRTRMHLSPPPAREVAALDAFGVAGFARAMSPSEMDQRLPSLFGLLRASLPATGGLFHYKLCSTFDSAPHIGSIGHAIDLAYGVFQTPRIPLLVAAPPLGRYCCFGNLFARSGGDSDVYRLDRHPTMRQHPVTPMDEADLRLHLARQTQRPVRLVDFRALEDPQSPNPLLEHPVTPDIVLFDALNSTHLERIGLFLLQAARHSTLAVFGSSGVEYALTAGARREGLLQRSLDPPRQPPPVTSVRQLLVVSGSCSPVTARQIQRALDAGFHDLALTPDELVGELAVEDAQPHGRPGPLIRKAVDHLTAGQSVILHTARGPDDPRIAQLRRRLAEACRDTDPTTGAFLGRRLGHLLKAILTRVPLPRVVVTGGDTSYFVAETLGLRSLDFLAPVAPGSPLCRVPEGPFAGLELLFKGGQVGKDDLLITLLQGIPPP